eukprot:CAMPEP_0175067784 /NCGR_PEP_ID=MMETSP0052_2-20121109/17296_1 /TAXON_ID=51329 ORGANISM="Polytomella parva, Strain SAG 63-3" /NCGR_SAMPLE_ID=MMETSP0052_2 /ASSEMBLY_ACC=CAM_ASM_000194 /LENGTH=392 /DNA_ID=CAMNT_0016334715 /DNA_START=51 /DNA_END=1229 /DNA_ORIENTATION=+
MAEENPESVPVNEPEASPVAVEAPPSDAAPPVEEAVAPPADDPASPVDAVPPVDSSPPADVADAAAPPADAAAPPADAAAPPAEVGAPVASEPSASVVTNINDSPEAKAELEAMAKKEAINVINTRRSNTGSRPPSGQPPVSSRRGSVTNAPSKRSSVVGEPSVVAATPSSPAPAPESSEAAAPASSDAAAAGQEVAADDGAAAAGEDGADEAAEKPGVGGLDSLEQSAPPKRPVRTGPWLTGTYRLPKSGKLITGEELCNALERMTNAYIDKYLKLGESGAGTLAFTGTLGGLMMTDRNTKCLTTDELDSLITRLYTPKDRTATSEEKVERVILRFDENGKEVWQPVKKVSPEEQQAYMVELYDRCLESRKKTAEELAAKYLKPLGMPRKF